MREEHSELECHDPDCYCHHVHDEHPPTVESSLAADLIQDSLVVSRSWKIQTASPITCTEVEERLRKGFLEIGDIVAVEGVILGHLKGSARVKSGAFITVSVTRQGEIDIIPSTDWDSHESSDLVDIDIAILSTQMADLSLEEYFTW